MIDPSIFEDLQAKIDEEADIREVGQSNSKPFCHSVLLLYTRANFDQRSFKISFKHFRAVVGLWLHIFEGME